MTTLRHRLAVTSAVVATASLAGVLGAVPATAQPAAPPIPQGMQQVVTDVLGPNDPGFWTPAVSGTRVLTPVDPGVQVACSTAYEPPTHCSSLDMRTVGSAQRSLAFIDVSAIGGPPLRLWFDYPKWGDGSTGDLTSWFLDRWQSR